MDSARESLALRREVLVAQAALQRLRAAHEVLRLRADLSWPLPARLGIAGLTLLAARRASRPLRTAAAVAGIALVVWRLARPAPDGD